MSEQANHLLHELRRERSHTLRGPDAIAPRATRPGHLFGTPGDDDLRLADLRGATGANGNGVTLEAEMLRAVEVKRQHDRAIAIYKSGLTVLRTALGRNA